MRVWHVWLELLDCDALSLSRFNADSYVRRISQALWNVVLRTIATYVTHLVAFETLNGSAVAAQMSVFVALEAGEALFREHCLFATFSG